MKIQFWGAARQVTGSRHLLTTTHQDKDTNILIDCGMDYEIRNPLIDPNQNFPFDPRTIDHVILTHAHIDHSGNLPNLVKQGFKGPIYCTEPTVELITHLLLDSYKIQKINLEKKNRKTKKKKKKSNAQIEGELLFNKKHIKQTLAQIKILSYNRNYPITDNIILKFNPAGHILGAASAKVTVNENGTTKSIGFTGDLGNYNSQLVVDPQPFSDIDYLVSESTYGGRFHSSGKLATDELEDYINKVCVKGQAKLVIPAFSVGRTQAILFILHQLYIDGRIPSDIKIFTDSPLAIKSTDIYNQYTQYLNDNVRKFSRKYGNLFEFENLFVLEDKASSDMLKSYAKPCVIVSAAGMVEGGRIQEHIANNIREENAMVLIAGYCSEGTLGHRLLQGQDNIKINKKIETVRASIKKTDLYSAHPDHAGLKKYIHKSIENSPSMKKIFLVHGDEISMEKLGADIDFKSVILPNKGDIYFL